MHYNFVILTKETRAIANRRSKSYNEEQQMWATNVSNKCEQLMWFLPLVEMTKRAYLSDIALDLTLIMVLIETPFHFQMG
jgi:hypothetical protein